MFFSAQRRPGLFAALLLTITFTALHNVCGLGFVDWDDPLHTYGNPALNPLTLPHYLGFWRAPYGDEYIPVSYSVYALLSRIAPFPFPVSAPGDAFTRFNPHVFHAANLCLHLANVLLVFSLLRRIVRHDAGAFAGALLFAVHPVQVEAVAWVSELRGLLAGCLGLGALYLYLRYAQAERAGDDSSRRVSRCCYAAALALFVLALLAKPSAVALPLLAWLLDWGVARRPLRRTLMPLIGWVAAALPIFWVTRSVQVVPPDLNLPLWQRPLIAADAVAFYLSKILVPLKLGADYGRTPASVLHSGAALWTGPLIIIMFALLMRRYGYCRSPLLVCTGLFVAALLPVLGFVPFLFQNLSTVGDRYLYLALIGPALAVAYAWARVGIPARLAFGVAIVLCIGLSAHQVLVWRNSRTLYLNTIAVNPDCGPMHYNLAWVYVTEGNKPAAIAEYREALRFLPADAPGHCYLGTLLGQCGDTAEGIDQLHLSTRLDPLFPLAHYNLGCLLFRAERRAEAAAQFRAALRLQPGNALALQALRRLDKRKA